MTKLSILSNILGNYYKAGQEYLFSCPFCDSENKKKLSINVSKNVWKCWLCDKRGKNLYYLIEKFGNSLQQQNWKSITGDIDLSVKTEFFPVKEKKISIKINLPSEFKTLTSKNTPTFAGAAKNFLHKRNITKEDILRYKIGFCINGEYDGRIIIPSFNNKGQINYFVGRTYYEGIKQKYKNPKISKDEIIFNELYFDEYEEIILCEGIFDCIVAGLNSFPILGSSLSENSLLFQRIVKDKKIVYMAMDSDAQSKQQRIINKLLKYGIIVYKINVNPFNDVGEMTKQEFQERKRKALKIDNNNDLIMRVNGIF